MKLIAKNKGFEIYFDFNTQSYEVFKDDKFLIGNNYKFSDVKSYIE